MQKEHCMLTKKDLSERWGKDARTISRLVAEKQIKPFRNTDLFPLDYIEALERENINFEIVNAFTLRAKDREIERLKKENTMLKSRLLQVTMIATEGTRELLEGQAV